MRRATVGDIQISGDRRLAMRCWEGHGRPLVLLHGFLDSASGWDGLARDTHRPCIALDLPGFGASDLPRQPRIGSYAQDVADALRELGVDDCTLVGHSLGGAVAAAVSELSPAVRSLVMLAPAGFGTIRLADAFALPGVNGLAAAALPLALASPLVITAAYATMVTRRRRPSRELVQRLCAGAATVAPGARAAVIAISASGHDPQGFVQRGVAFDGPVAVLWGEHDALVPRSHISRVRQAIPHAHVQVWPSMGHHPQRERPQALARFIEQHACRARRVPGRRRGLVAGPIRHPAQRRIAARLRPAA